MKNAFCFIFIFCFSVITFAESKTQYVNPFIGTANNGHTFPGAAMPFGFIQTSPETGNTGWRYCSGYNYADSIIIGFAQNHLNGTGCLDLGDILFLPFSGTLKDKDYSSRFDKKSEKAIPGYYKVNLADFGVDVELTATDHTAFHKYTFNKGDAHILVNLQSGLSGDDNVLKNRVIKSNFNIENETIVSGQNRVRVWVSRNFYYVIEFSKPFKKSNELPKAKGENAKKIIFDFDVKPGESIMLKIAISTVSVEGAKFNLKTENPGWNFINLKNKANNVWENLLSRVKIEGNQAQKENFYTSLYHLYLQPSNIADVNGQYRGANDSVFTSPSKQYYSTLSLWDTFRAAHPLYTILMPERVDNLVASMLEHYRTAGILPIWTLWGKETYCMIGNHAIPVIVDAYMKGFRGFDIEKAYEAIKMTATTNHINSNWDIYTKYGYFPFDLEKKESVSRTLENCIDDWSIALMARSLGKEDDYQFFSKRAQFYKKLFDPQTKFMRGKDSKGNWRIPFDALGLSHASSFGGDYTEGNAWQYTWHVPQDVEGLTELFGGKEKLAYKLDSLFKLESTIKGAGFVLDVTGLIGQYAHGNEPSHHVAYLFTLLDKGWRTQELVREINDKFYINKPDGLCGNDDCGQMSAWYIFTAMGFYPVNPVSGQYVFGAPQLPKVTLALPGNKNFSIEAKNLSVQNKYVQSIILNGKVYDKEFINHIDIMNGGKLIYIMGPNPKINKD